MDESKIEHRMQELREKAGKLANAQAMRYQLDHSRKAVLAMAMKTAEQHGHKSVAAQEREAYASAEYRQWLDGSTEAVRNHERLRLEFKVIELRAEIWRTMQATRRAEMTLR